MNLNDLFADDIADVLLNADEFAESLTLLSPEGAERAITAVIDRLPERTELRSGHRLRVEPVLVYATETTGGLGGVTDQWAAKIDTDPTTSPFDFQEFQENDAGLRSALFERVTILETGIPQPADI